MTGRILTGLIMLPVIILILTGCWVNDGDMAEEPVAVAVEVAEIKVDAGPAGRQFAGLVVPYRQAKLAFSVPGRIEAIKVSENSDVHSGQVLLSLAKEDYVRQVSLAQAQLEVSLAQLARAKTGAREAEILAAQANLLEVKALVKQRQQELDELQKMPEDLASGEMMQKASMALEVVLAREQAAQAAVDALAAGPTLEELAILQAQVKVAEAALAVAKGKLAETDLVAPWSGRILKIMATQGEVLGVGVPTVVLGEVDRVRVVINNPSGVRYRRGDQAFIPFAGLTGEVHSIGGVYDAGTHTQAVELIFANPDNRLIPGSVVMVEITKPAEVPLVTIPVSAVVRRGKGAHVFVVEGQFAFMREVRLGELTGDRFVVHSGLAEGERIVTAGAGYLSHGDRVRIVGGDSR